uniref:C2 domain-containing protein n=1 Tax=Knipowitschia caucasica TaxID=637954 RepID=A0AAV2JS96_KNICA
MHGENLERSADVAEQSAKEKAKGEQLLNTLLVLMDSKQGPGAGPASVSGPGPGSDLTVKVGLESAVQKKSEDQSMVEVQEVVSWVREVQPAPARLLYGETPAKVQVPETRPRGKPVQVPELQLDVRTSRQHLDRNEFGYVITDTDGLQTDEGLHLMEVLAHMSNIHMANFAELSVVGPAVTFRVSPNIQNVTTADVANVAVCSLHFHSGKPAYEMLENHPDWTPSLLVPVKVTYLSGSAHFPLGEIQLTLRHSSQRNRLIVVVHSCRNLIAFSEHGSDPYVRLYLLPDKRRSGRRKTSTFKKNQNPVYDQTFEFSVSVVELHRRTLDVAVKNGGGLLSKHKGLLGKVTQTHTITETV